MADNILISFQKRISYLGDLKKILQTVCRDFSLGEYQDHEVIPFGYEDLNLRLVSASGEFFIKIFAKNRSDQECHRYIDTVSQVIGAGVKHPKLFTTSGNFLYAVTIDDHKIRLCVQEFIDGQTFYQMKRKPDEIEATEIISQAAIINRINFKPEPIYDNWAVVNFLSEYQKIKKFLSTEDINVLQPIAEEFGKIKQDKLPHCFVHGDIIETNVIKTSSNELYILDFSVSNYYPRIVELTMLLCNLFFDHTSGMEKFLKTYNFVVGIYSQFIHLSEEELVLLPLFIKVAHAMQLIGAKQTQISEGDSVENNHWLKAGRDGLKFCNQVWS